MHILINFDKYYYLSSGFCHFGQWKKILIDNTFNLLSKLNTELEFFFYFEVYTLKLMKFMRHLSLFSVCSHFLRCFPSCYKVPKSKFCFYCSQVKARNYEKPTYFLDVIVDQRDFEEQSCEMVGSHKDRLIIFNSPKFSRKCNFYEEICNAEFVLFILLVF